MAKASHLITIEREHGKGIETVAISSDRVCQPPLPPPLGRYYRAAVLNDSLVHPFERGIDALLIQVGTKNCRDFVSSHYGPLPPGFPGALPEAFPGHPRGSLGRQEGMQSVPPPQSWYLTHLRRGNDALPSVEYTMIGSRGQIGR